MKEEGTGGKFTWYDDNERAVVDFATGYLSADEGKYLESTELSIKYLDYDWSLNEVRE